MDKRKIVKICLVLFAISAGVRLLVWQNNKLVIEEPQWVLADIYKLDARLLVAGDLKTFLTGNDPPSDTTIIMHPPGVSDFSRVSIFVIWRDRCFSGCSDPF